IHPASRDDGVHVGMEAQVARPRVQHHRHPQGRIESTLTELEQRFSGAAKQRIEDGPRHFSAQSSHLARHREDDVKVPHGQEPFRARSYPPLLCQALALWTVSVATGVVRWLLMSARATHFEVVAEHRRATPLDGGEHTLLGSTPPMLAFELGSVPISAMSKRGRPAGAWQWFTRTQPVLRIRSSGLFVLASTAVLTRAYRVVVRMLS